MATTGENEQGICKVMDLTRLLSITLLLLQFHYCGYSLTKNYRCDGAEVTINISGTFIYDEAIGHMAKQVSALVKKIMQAREKLSINQTDTSLKKFQPTGKGYGYMKNNLNTIR